jgi:hypothetical protein
MSFEPFTLSDDSSALATNQLEDALFQDQGIHRTVRAVYLLC